LIPPSCKKWFNIPFKLGKSKECAKPNSMLGPNQNTIRTTSPYTGPRNGPRENSGW
jgi:hypothetical protein